MFIISDFEYDMKIKSCLGCFNCWTKTPGCCIIHDESNEISRSMIKCNNLIIVSKIVYGGYSPYIKRILDRSIPNILPFFKVVNNEMHHKPRYKKYPKLTVIGYGANITDSEKNTFKKLVKANSINLQNNQYEVFIVSSIDEVKQLISKIEVKNNE
ncbi:flavodoxin family protein [Romboutsia weinsteinii]|uniref:Flavodoxin family protein n=1 Tax=Romboutsia weinsteinii TaxID=2020949 RepID=A0A371IY20_9FIRM|nr:NAD(P)H-dependent oxidoreductase [Romboutsia weinsteinii]RDY25385.1 flavodoxin family protein [Romboutsia weinsteinii]